MTETTTIRVSRTTRDELRRLADSAEQSVAQTVEQGVRLLQQERMGEDLSQPLTQDEVDWLGADAG